MENFDEVKLSRKDRPARNWIENPFTWWGGTPLGWNKAIPIWSGTGEMEALCELFFDNLATLLGTTGVAVGLIGYGIIGNNEGINSVPGYGLAIAQEWEQIYFTRNIPGCAFALLFGNLYYAWQCGRLGAKEGRTDVTAQPYGMNTTGIFITLFAVNLTALFAGAFKYIDMAMGTATTMDVEAPACSMDADNNPVIAAQTMQQTTYEGGDVQAAAYQAAEFAWQVGVASNFVMGLFEMLGAVIGETMRKLIPTAAFYSPLVGIGFVWLAFSPMLKVAAEPMMCLVPLLVIMCGFFGGVRYKVVGKVTFPIALLAISIATIAGWAGACKHTNLGAEKYGYGLPFFDNEGWVTCSGTSEVALKEAYDKYAFGGKDGSLAPLKDAVFRGLGGFGEVGTFASTIFLVAMVSFTATMTCVESASAAGDDYPIGETMLVDGAGTCFGALFGSIYSTTVYIGHPIHKALGAKRGYSLINGVIYFFLLNSGLFAAIYNAIPECANGAILTFVGLLLGRQAFEETNPRHYPALLFCAFPYICNWAKLGNMDEGVQMMGQAGGLLFSLILTWIFCLCIDRDFFQAMVLSVACIFLSLFGIFASHNMANEDGTAGNEKIGFYGKVEEDYNNGWRWAVSWTLAAAFFGFQLLLQRIDYIPAKIGPQNGFEQAEHTPASQSGEAPVVGKPGQAELSQAKPPKAIV